MTSFLIVDGAPLPQPLPVNKGVPQGSFLGPVLLNLHQQHSSGKADTRKWNDESCMKNKKKTALCFTVSCQSDSCYHGECVETINSHSCKCSEGFYGEQCEHGKQAQDDIVQLSNTGSMKQTEINMLFIASFQLTSLI
uniref:EGF-like domain-containing protein n=1 Tax=Oncorhynchus kisutch TaxID=8019 RepID=A0A8C7JBD1_ONCKI